MTANEMYDMKLNKSVNLSTTDGLMITRVPGGWVYTYHRLDAGQMNSVFVPLNNEFLIKE